MGPAAYAPLACAFVQSGHEELLCCGGCVQVQQRGLVMAGESGIFTPEDVAFVQSGA